MVCRFFVWSGDFSDFVVVLFVVNCWCFFKVCDSILIFLWKFLFLVIILWSFLLSCCCKILVLCFWFLRFLFLVIIFFNFLFVLLSLWVVRVRFVCNFFVLFVINFFFCRMGCWDLERIFFFNLLMVFFCFVFEKLLLGFVGLVVW